MKRILTGPRFVVEALRAQPKRGGVHVIYALDPEAAALQPLREAAARVRVPIEQRDRDTLDALASGHKHQNVVAIAGEYSYVGLPELLEASPPLLVALDGVTDPHNFGAILRSAVAFGAGGVLIPKHGSATVTPTVVRASAGLSERAVIARVTNLQRTLQQLGKEGYSVVGLAGEAEQTLAEVRASTYAPYVLVIGSEGKGMRRMVRERCTALARIEYPGPAESLNASVAAGVALYALTQ